MTAAAFYFVAIPALFAVLAGIAEALDRRDRRRDREQMRAAWRYEWGLDDRPQTTTPRHGGGREAS